MDMWTLLYPLELFEGVTYNVKLNDSNIKKQMESWTFPTNLSNNNEDKRSKIKINKGKFGLVGNNRQFSGNSVDEHRVDN